MLFITRPRQQQQQRRQQRSQQRVTFSPAVAAGETWPRPCGGSCAPSRPPSGSVPPSLASADPGTKNRTRENGRERKRREWNGGGGGLTLSTLNSSRPIVDHATPGGRSLVPPTGAIDSRFLTINSPLRFCHRRPKRMSLYYRQQQVKPTSYPLVSMYRFRLGEGRGSGGGRAEQIPTGTDGSREANRQNIPTGTDPVRPNDKYRQATDGLHKDNPQTPTGTDGPRVAKRREDNRQNTDRHRGGLRQHNEQLPTDPLLTRLCVAATGLMNDCC